MPCGAARTEHPMRKIALLFLLLSAPVRADGLPPGFARLSDIAPAVKQDMRYAGADNFTGAPVPGYRAAQCWLRREAAQALAAAQREAHAKGFDLVVFDCYRPQRAVAAFQAWSKNPDEGSKAAHYPNIDKRSLFAQGYIAARSGHSTGYAVDLGVVGWDFGAPFDFFDRSAWTATKTAHAARAHRQALLALMSRHGFVNYPREWWHFTFQKPHDSRVFDAEIE